MPLLQPVALPGERSRAQELYAWLRAAIERGELEPHERLVETAIADLASVSRTPVREALQRLEFDGLVREGDGGGLEVCGFSLDELADLCTVRATLEGLVTELAANTRSDLEIETLRRIVVAERNTLGGEEVDAQIELNHAFHDTVWRASRNRYLADELWRLRSLIERLQETTLRDPRRLGESIREHAAIVRALEVRDTEAAQRLGREHFERAMSARLSTSETPRVPAAQASPMRREAQGRSRA